MRKVGISTHFDDLNRACFAEYRKAGVSAFELSVAWNQYALVNIAAVAKDALAEDIMLWSVHLPYSKEISIANPDDTARRNTVAMDIGIIQKAGDSGFTRCVVHPSSEPIADEDREKCLRLAQDSLAVLADTAKKAGVILAVEDLPRTCLCRTSDEMLRLMETDPSLRVCFDTNHILIEDFGVYLDAVRDRLTTVHISDYDYFNERHWLPGEGSIEWPRLMDKLDEIGYDGVFMYEVSKASSPTITRPAPITAAQFMQNAVELHERRPLTPRGVPVPNLGMWGPRDRE